MACSSQSYIEEMLTCPVCLEVVTEPRTLTNCFHNFCKICVDQLIEKHEGDKAGVLCPLCREFSGETEIRSNFMVNELLSHYKAKEDQFEKQAELCEQCEGDPAKAEWKCLDCHFKLCGKCRSMHLKIPLLKGHQILKLTKGSDKIDQLVFCHKHTDKAVEFYCYECETTSCILCQAVDHKLHNVVAVEDGLKIIAHEARQYLDTIDINLAAVEKTSQKLDEHIESLRNSFSTCRESLRQKTEEMIDQLRTQQDLLEEELTEQEDKQIAQLDLEKTTLTRLQYNLSQIQSTTKASLENFCNTSLLSELLSGGLLKMLKEATGKMVQCESISVTLPVLGDLQHLPSPDIGYVEKILSFDDAKVDERGARHFMGNYGALFAGEYEVDHQEESCDLYDFNSAFTICNNAIWTPSYHDNKIQIYSLDGKLLRSIATPPKPSKIESSSVGDIFVMCSDQGLYVMNTSDETFIKMSPKNYSCMCTYHKDLFVLDWKQKRVIQFCKNQAWMELIVCHLKWMSRMSEEPYYRDSLLVTNSEDDGTGVQFFIYVGHKNTLYQVDSKGFRIKQFQGVDDWGGQELTWPRACGIDQGGQLLVADCESIKILDIHTGSWKMAVDYCEQSVEDIIVIENTMYALIFGRDSSILLSQRFFKEKFNMNSIPDQGSEDLPTACKHVQNESVL